MNHNKRKELQKKKEELILGACKQRGKDISKLLYIQGDETQVGPKYKGQKGWRDRCEKIYY